MHHFRMKITIAFLIVLTALVGIIGIYVGKLLENTYLDLLENRLSKEATIISDEIIFNHLLENREQLQNQILQFSRGISARITVIDKEGKVLADSESDPHTLPNHLYRPEVQGALKTGMGQIKRYSITVKHDMLYIAIPMLQNGDVTGVIRLAVPETIVSDTVKKIWFSLTIGLLVTFFVFGIIIGNVSHMITRPIEEIIKVTRQVTGKKYNKRIKINPKGELGQLAQAINFMIESLDQQMRTLKENKQRLQGIINNMFSGILLVSDTRRIVLANEASTRLFGYSLENLIGCSYQEIGMNTGLNPLIERCFECGEKVRDEIHLYYPEEKIIDVNLASYKNDAGEIKGVIVLLHDITSIRRLEKLRSEFVTNVSHELKTPITSIKGFTETLLDGALEDQEISRHFLTIINEESDRLYRLISDILDLSRIEQKKMPLKIEEINIIQLIKETASILGEEAREKGIALILPPEDNPIIFEGDSDRCRQILLNLVSNGIHYTYENGEVVIKVRETPEKEIELQISDTGIGIAPEHLPRIFERFYRVDKARSRESGGTGLGLAIVKHLVESHHGHITVESQEGKGTTFTVVLPKYQPK